MLTPLFLFALDQWVSWLSLFMWMILLIHVIMLMKLRLSNVLLGKKFAIKDLGFLKYFFSIEMATSSKGVLLNQRKYTLNFLQEAEIEDCKPARTPFNSKMTMDMGGDPLDIVSYYQCLVGKLIYLTITKSYITFTVSLISQFMHSPATTHLQVVKRVLRYLKGSISQRILMKNNSNIDSWLHRC